MSALCTREQQRVQRRERDGRLGLASVHLAPERTYRQGMMLLSLVRRAITLRGPIPSVSSRPIPGATPPTVPMTERPVFDVDQEVGEPGR